MSRRSLINEGNRAVFTPAAASLGAAGVGGIAAGASLTTASVNVIGGDGPGASQSAGRILIIVGDAGLGDYNVGRNFERVAQTKQEGLEAQGYTVIVKRASNFKDFRDALTSNGMLDGVEYVGHASNIKLFVGEQAGAGTNVDHSNIPGLENANLNPNAYIKLNTCNAGAGGQLSIGQWLANRLGRSVLAFDGPTHFYGGSNPNPVRTSPRPGEQPPAGGPLRLLEDRGTRLVTIRPG